MENNATIVNGVENGQHVVNGPLTTEVTNQASPSLLVNEIDRQIVKIRPMATPVDQLSRCAGAKRTGSMIVDYYNVDTKPTSVSLVSSSTNLAGNVRGRLKTDNNDSIDVSDTLLVEGVTGYTDAGEPDENSRLVLYVVGKDDVELMVMAVNGEPNGAGERIMPELDAGERLIRMGRAATELDVQTAQFEALPQKAQNYCQIFKMQIEQSTLQKIANKEVDWTMTDQEEAVMLTGGIWGQAGKTFAYSDGALTQDTVIDLMREAFTGNAGSKRKVLIGGSGLIGRLNKLDYTKMISAGENVAKWGIDFTEMRSKFGKLYVLLSEVFDECGMPDNGMIIDPEYLQKYSHLPFGTEALNLKSAGVRNTDALVLTEASCLVLRYPKAHVRIVME